MKYTDHQKDEDPIKFRAVTVSCNACSLFELQEVTTFSGKTTAEAFDQVWLCRYPRPHVVIFDQGTEFKKEFIEQLQDYGMEGKQIMVRNPQGNGKHERLHAIVHSIVRNFDFPATIERGRPYVELMQRLIADVTYAMRARWLHVAQYTPGQLAFNRDMVLNTPINVDWTIVRERMIAANRKATAKENKKRFNHVYRIGDIVWLINDSTRDAKYNKRKTGPFTIVRMISDSAIVIRKANGYTQSVSVRQLTPYK